MWAISGVCWAVSVVAVPASDDSREVGIIKQINRVNEDGTYTFGYEAADGSFKIETRDVLGTTPSFPITSTSHLFSNRYSLNLPNTQKQCTPCVILDGKFR